MWQEPETCSPSASPAGWQEGYPWAPPHLSPIAAALGSATLPHQGEIKGDTGRLCAAAQVPVLLIPPVPTLWPGMALEGAQLPGQALGSLRLC